MRSAKQAQAGDAYRLPIEFGFTGTVGGPLEIEAVTMASKTLEFSIPVEIPPAELVLDPDTKLLAKMTFGKR